MDFESHNYDMSDLWQPLPTKKFAIPYEPTYIALVCQFVCSLFTA